MKPLLFILLLVSQAGICQNQLDFGEINGRSINTCVDSANGTICKSKNQFEVYITEANPLFGKYISVRLSYNGVKWSAIKYEGDWIRNRIDSFDLKPALPFDTIFNALKTNRLFILPDQKDIKVKESVDDGDEYSLSFKAGDRFRNYEFNNPLLYKKYNEDVVEFTNYVNIVEILFKWLKKE